MIDTKIIQVTNIAPVVTKDQMKTLFSYVGKIDELKLFPERWAQKYMSILDHDKLEIPL